MFSIILPNYLPTLDARKAYILCWPNEQIKTNKVLIQKYNSMTATIKKKINKKITR